MDIGNGKFNLMALCWGEGHGSSIHDHADAHCFVKVLDGTLRETLFAWPENSEEEAEMTKLSVNDYQKDSVAYINGQYSIPTLILSILNWWLVRVTLVVAFGSKILGGGWDV